MQISEAFDLIKDEIAQIEEVFTENLVSDAHLIGKVGEYIQRSGGKRFRPLALLLSARLCGYKGSDHIPMALVVEFLHTATLLHDDVVDSATLRRGTESANNIWGNSSSVLVGDYLFSKAFSLAVDTGSIPALKTLASTTTAMAEGEVLQLSKHSDSDITEEEYLKVITNKTARLFSASCEVAAILSRATAEKQKALHDYGLCVGIAFQLVDDCLDYTSRNEELGKAIGNDLKEGKVTMPLIKSLREANREEREIIIDAVKSESSDNGNFAEVYAIIKKYSGIEYTMDFACKQRELAKAHLEHFEPNTDRAALTAVADFVISRNN